LMCGTGANQKGGLMLRYALGFFIVALIAAVFGFTGIAVAAAGIAKLLFFLFIILFAVSLLAHVLRRQ
jgi:uncharacterized membrane protein YtjA (UPF0391 family)